ncbi:MAG: Ku protein [Methanomassiliicoccales archaeon]
MKMKSIWNGFISFGMVNIPVKLYSAIRQASRVNFRLLYAKDNAPVHYKLVRGSRRGGPVGGSGEGGGDGRRLLLRVHQGGTGEAEA